MPHDCNAWCFGGIHALLFDSEHTDRVAIEGVARALAGGAGLSFVGVSQVAAMGAPAPGTNTAEGIARGRMVIWAK